MKVLFFSDLHGNATMANLLVKAFKAEQADVIVGCGDYLGYSKTDNRYIADLLNGYATKMLGVYGNNDFDLSSLLLFPLYREYSTLMVEERRFFISHGHLYNARHLPPSMGIGDIFVQGHSHIAEIRQANGVLYLNPGSSSSPRNHYPASYAIYDKGIIEIKAIKTLDLLLSFLLT